MVALIATLPEWDREESDDDKLRRMGLEPERLRTILRMTAAGTNEHTPADAPGFSGYDNYNTVVNLLTLAINDNALPGWRRIDDHNQPLFMHDRGIDGRGMQILVASSNPGGARKGAYSTTKNDRGKATQRRIDESLRGLPPAQPSLFAMAQNPDNAEGSSVPLWFLLYEIGEDGTCCASLKLVTGYEMRGEMRPECFPVFNGEQISIIDEKGEGSLPDGYNGFPDRGIDPADSAISITRKE